jgi:hypothetical protein
MAEGRWEDEVCRIGFGVWSNPVEAMRANPYRPKAVQPAANTEWLDVIGAALGRANREGGVTSG